MIELHDDALVFRFPEVHEDARFSVTFQRTLRVPDDGREYPLPAGLGRFPLRHVDDFADRVPDTWRRRGGVLLPMHQAEAMWLDFSGSYPAALKVAAGKINAVTGEPWTPQLHGAGAMGEERHRSRSKHPAQDYLALPDQPWLDGFNVADGQVRQFVAMPLGRGATAEEQITGRADVGGVQLLAYPVKREFYHPPARWAASAEVADLFLASPVPPAGMGLGLGGKIKQDVEADTLGTDAHDVDRPARCFVHLVNAAQWEAITGEPMPTAPITRADYARSGIPWFDYSAAGPKVPGSQVLAELRSVADVARMSDDDGIPIDRIHVITPRRRTVRQSPELDAGDLGAAF